jgi:hypothetical protein
MTGISNFTLPRSGHSLADVNAPTYFPAELTPAER